MKDQYLNFAKVYDQYFGQREEIPFIQELILQYHPEAQSVLEMACGTGALLAPLYANYSVTGVDLSEDMLSVARHRLPSATLIQGDICSIRLEKKYDIILCLFNSINHLLTQSNWKKFFSNVDRHLKKDGVFIFDMETPWSFEKYFRKEEVVHKNGLDVHATTYYRNSRGNIDINCKVFKHLDDDLYQLAEARIEERSFPLETVEKWLKKPFSNVSKVDPERARPTSKSEVLYFICRNN